MQGHWTLAIAIWGAVVSTLSLSWNIYRELLNRPKLKVDYSTGGPTKTFPDGSVTLTLTNLRDRPITITEWGFEGEHEWPPGKKWIGDMTFSGSDFPRILRESEQTNLTAPAQQILNKRTRGIFVRDSFGKKWRVKGNPSKLLERHKIFVAGCKLAESEIEEEAQS